MASGLENFILYWLSPIIGIIILHFNSAIIYMLAISKVVHPVNRVLISIVLHWWCPISPFSLADEKHKNSDKQNHNEGTDSTNHNYGVWDRCSAVIGKLTWGPIGWFSTVMEESHLNKLAFCKRMEAFSNGKDSHAIASRGASSEGPLLRHQNVLHYSVGFETSR